GSWEVFFTDLTSAYTGDPLKPAPRASSAASGSDEDDVAYWRAGMVDPPEPLELPGPSGSAVPTGWRSQRTSLRLGADVADRVTVM
ncbi:hypothetical protein C6A85_35875, partial [Mycobacterium sp. ITM-2017-0098]